MKKLILISLLVMFGCEDNGDTNIFQSNDRTELSWAYDSTLDRCYFTDESDFCPFNGNLSFGVKVENIYLAGIDTDGSSPLNIYAVELCDCSYILDVDYESGYPDYILTDINTWAESPCSDDYLFWWQGGCNLNTDIESIKYK